MDRKTNSKFQFVMSSIRLEIKDIINTSWLIDYLDTSVKKLFKMAEDGILIVDTLRKMKFSDAYKMRVLKLM